MTLSFSEADIDRAEAAIFLEQLDTLCEILPFQQIYLFTTENPPMMTSKYNVLDLVIDLCGHRNNKGYIAVFRVYLDDSDAKSSSVASIGGYLGHVDTWEAYEQHAAHVYTEFGISRLHAIDFKDRKNDFKDWTTTRKLQFLDRLYEICSNHFMLGTSFHVAKKPFASKQKEVKELAGTSPYSLAFMIAMNALARDNIHADKIAEEGLSIFIEDGHRNDGGILQYFNLAKSKGFFGDNLRSLTFSKKDDSKAIQLADFHAYYARRHADKHLKAHRKSIDLEVAYGRIISKCEHQTFTVRDPWTVLTPGTFDNHKTMNGSFYQLPTDTNQN